MAAAHILERYMRICFVTDGDLSAYAARAREADLVVCGFQSLGEVSYERELRGETALFADAAILSRVGQNVVVCGCYTDARGIRRKSAVVAERGKILGVSDMVNRIDGGEYRCGAGIRVYDTKAGKLGVIVAEDLYFPQVLQTVSLCGAELAVCLFEQLNETLGRRSRFVYDDFSLNRTDTIALFESLPRDRFTPQQVNIMDLKTNEVCSSLAKYLWCNDPVRILSSP